MNSLWEKHLVFRIPLIVLAGIGIIFTFYKFSHPELTETQLALDFWWTGEFWRWLFGR